MIFRVQQFILLFLLFAVSAIGRTVLPAPEPLATQLAEITETARQRTCPLALGSVYDAAGRLIKSTDADLTTAEYRYDSIGNLILEKKRDNTVIVRIYDGLSRLCEVRTLTVADSSAFAALDYTNLPTNILQQKFAYDSFSRLTQAIDYNADGTSTQHTVDFEYDANGNLILEAQDTDAPVKVVYDAAGNPIELHYPDTDNVGDYLGHVTINRDEAHRPDQITWTPADSADTESVCDYTEYNGRNEPIAATIGSDIEFTRQIIGPGMEFSREFKWDTDDRILLAAVADNTFQPSFSELGLPEDHVVNFAVFASPDTGGWLIENSLGYDERARLDNADETVTFSASSGNNSHAWLLDKVGNWDVIDQSDNWTTNCDNEYTASPPYGNPSYDANGNLTGLDGKTFVYDWANRLIEAKVGETTVANYSYDALGRRVTKYVAATTTTTRYIHSGSQIIEELVDTGSGYELTRTYIHSAAIDRPVAVKHWSAGAVTDTYYFLADRQGSVLALMKDNGASPSTIVETYSYTLYGVRRIYHYDGTVNDKTGVQLNSGLPVEYTTSLVGNDIGFTGRRWDAESSLWHYRFRQYSPTLGRFLTRDPAGYIDGLNLYQYVRSNPLAYTDPWGLGTSKLPPKDLTNPFDPLHIGAAYVADFFVEGTAEVGRQAGDLVDIANVPFQYAVGKMAGAESTSDAITVGEQFWRGNYSDIGNIPDQVQGALYTAEDFYNPYLNNSLDLDLERAANDLAFVTGANAYEFSVLAENLRYSAQYGETWVRSSLSPTPTPAPRNAVLSGHGELVGQGASPIVHVPEGTSVTVWREHGAGLYDDVANVVELGEDIPAAMHNRILGARTYLPGSYMPDYTLLPPVDPPLVIMGNPTTVKKATALSELLVPNQGNVNWAACLIDRVVK